MYVYFLDFLLDTSLYDLMNYYVFNAFVILPIYSFGVHYSIFSFLQFLGFNYDIRTKLKCFVSVYVMCLNLGFIAQLWSRHFA